MPETVGATNTRIFLWRFVAETDGAVKNINRLHRVAQTLTAQTASVAKRTQAAQNQVAQGASAIGKKTTSSLGSTAAAAAAVVTVWYTLRNIIGSTIEDTDRLTRVLMLSGEGYKNAGTSAAKLLDTYTRISGVALPEMIDATEELVASGVRGTDSIAALAETSVKMGYALGLSSKEVARTLGSMQSVLGLTTEQVTRQANAMVGLVIQGKATASMLLQVAQNTLFAAKVTGIATQQFLAMAAAMEKAGMMSSQAAAATTEWANMLSEDFGVAAAPFVNVQAYQKLMAGGIADQEKAIRMEAAGWARMGKTAQQRLQMARTLGMSQTLALAKEATLTKGLEQTIEMHKLAAREAERNAAVNEAFGWAMSTLSGALKTITNNLKGFAMAAGVVLLPILSALLWPLKVLSNLLASLPIWIKAPISAIGLLVIGFVGLVFALGQLVKVVNMVSTAWKAGIAVMKLVRVQYILNTAAIKLHNFWLILTNKALRLAWIEYYRMLIAQKADLAIKRVALGVMVLWAALTTGQTASIQANTTATVLNTMAGWASTAVKWALAAATGAVTVATWLWNTAMGVSTGILGVLAGAATFMGGALMFVLAPLWAVIVATWAWTVALLANPLTWIVLAVVAAVALLVGGFMLLFKHWDLVWSAIKFGIQIVVDLFKWLWDMVVEGAKLAVKYIWLLMGPIGWLIKGVMMLKDAMFGSGFLHIEEGVDGATRSLRKLSNAYGAVGSAAENAYDRASGEVTVGATTYPGARMVGKVGAGAAAGGGGGGGGPTVMPGGGVRDITIPITVMLDGRVLAETVVKVGKDQLMRMHGLPRRTMRGVPALG